MSNNAGCSLECDIGRPRMAWVSEKVDECEMRQQLLEATSPAVIGCWQNELDSAAGLSDATY